MADDRKNDKTGPISGILNRILSDPEWLIVGYYAYNALRTGVVSEGAPDKAKAAAKGLGATVGGKGDPTDEAYFLYYSEGIAAGRSEKEVKELRFFLRTGLATVFRLNHESEREVQRGLADFEEWRSILVKIGQIDANFALAYLTELAESFRSEFANALTWVEENSKTLDEKLSDKQKKVLLNKRHGKAWQRACDEVAKQMHSDSIKVPLYDLEPLGQRLWQKLVEKGPMLMEAKARGLRFLKPRWRFLRRMTNRSTKKNYQRRTFWRWKLTTLRLWMEDSEHVGISLREAHKKNRDDGMGKIASIRHASRTSAEAREGPWKNRTFRLGAFLKPWN